MAVRHLLSRWRSLKHVYIWKIFAKVLEVNQTRWHLRLPQWRTVKTDCPVPWRFAVAYVKVARTYKVDKLAPFFHSFALSARTSAKILLLRLLGCKVFPVLKHTDSKACWEVEASLTSTLMMRSAQLSVPAALSQYPLRRGLGNRIRDPGVQWRREKPLPLVWIEQRLILA